MSQILPTVLIGIPAHNEEKNIRALLRQLFGQQPKNCFIKQIVVVLDGCSDGTFQIVSEIAKENYRIKLINDHQRLGKPSRMNQIFGLADTDVVVIMDSDVAIKSESLIEDLVNPIFRNENVELTSGPHFPISTRTFTQKVVWFGEELWEKAIRRTKNSQMYRCGGQIRAFGKPLYKKITIPSMSADDVYPYLVAKSLGLQFRYVANARVFFQVPATFADYCKQTKRFLRSEKIQTANFDIETVKRHYTITGWVKMRILLWFLVRRPFMILTYLFFLSVPKFLALFDRFESDSKWEIIYSTKKAINEY